MEKEEQTRPYEPSEVTHRMVLTNQMHKKLLEKRVDGFGLHRAQHRLLMTLACKKFSSQVDLAKHLEVSPATIAVTLKAMEKAGLINKRMRREDNRVNFVELTEAGKKIVEESGEVFQALDQTMYRGFSEKEREQLGHFFDRMYENMQQTEKIQKDEEERDGTV